MPLRSTEVAKQKPDSAGDDRFPEMSEEEIQERVLNALAEVLGAGHLDWKKHPQQNAPTTDRIQ